MNEWMKTHVWVKTRWHTHTYIYIYTLIGNPGGGGDDTQ